MGDGGVGIEGSTGLEPATRKPKSVVAISSRALFDFEEENRLFESGQGDVEYMAEQLRRLEQCARPGAAFPLATKLLALNAGSPAAVELVVVSRNDPISG